MKQRARITPKTVSISKWVQRLTEFDREFKADVTATVFTVKALMATDGPDANLAAMKPALILELFRVIQAARKDAREGR